MTSVFRMRIVALMTVLLFASPLLAQKYSEKGDKYYDKNLFREAIEYYKLEIKAGNSKTVDYAMQKLANCYRITEQFALAEETYKKILKKKKKDPKNYLNYAQSLKSSAKYAEAAVQFKEYIKLNPADPMGVIYLQSCDSAQKWLDETIGNEVRNVEKINSPLSDFAPVFLSSDKLYFSSSREGSKEALVSLNGGVEIHRLDLYDIDIASLDANKEVPLKNFTDINTPLHEGPATFSANGKELYFTRTVDGKKNKTTNKVLNTLQIFYCSQDSTGKWSKPVSAFTFNSTEYSVGQPSLTGDGKRIYFMSDMPGGYGGTDIYYCDKLADGKWSSPVNVGNKVNTFGHELFPYISANGLLYFSSDTHPGMGQLDIFSSTYTNGEWSVVRNLKPPVNSIANDFGIALDQQYMRGFFSSDRFNGKGLEDIYSFSEIIPLKLTVNGGMIQFPDKSIFDGIKYKLVDEKTKTETTLEPKDGVYSLPLNESQQYTLVGKKNGFSYNKIAMNIVRDTLGNYLEVKLKPTLKPVMVDGYLTSATKGDTAKKTKEGPVNDVLVFLVDSTTIMEHHASAANGYYNFSHRLNGNREYTIIAKIGVPKEPPPVVKAVVPDSLQNIRLNGDVKDAAGGVKNAQIVIRDGGAVIAELRSDELGAFRYSLSPEREYTITANANGYLQKEITVSTKNIAKGSSLPALLMLDSLKVNAVIELKNLYYDYNKADVQFASIPALDKLVEFMRANPGVTIELAANTDSRGNADYNKKLSQARAQKAKDFLTVEDISPSRVIPVGYGKSNPLIGNAKTEEEHQVNRRTEIRILKK